MDTELVTAEVAVPRPNGLFFLKAAFGGYAVALALIMANYFLMLGRQPHIGFLEPPNWGQLLQDRASYLDIAKLSAIWGTGLAMILALAGLSLRAGERSRFAFIRELAHQARRKYSPLRHIILASAWLAFTIALVNAVMKTPLQIWFPHGRAATNWFGTLFITLSAAAPIFAGLLATGISGLVVHNLLKEGEGTSGKATHWIAMIAWACGVAYVTFLVVTSWMPDYDTAQMRWAIGINLSVLALAYFMMMGSHLSACWRSGSGAHRLEDPGSTNLLQTGSQSVVMPTQRTVDPAVNEAGPRVAGEADEPPENDNRSVWRRFIKYYIFAYVAQANIPFINQHMLDIAPGSLKQTLILGTSLVIIRLILPGQIYRPLKAIYEIVKIIAVGLLIVVVVGNTAYRTWISETPVLTLLGDAMGLLLLCVVLASILDGSIFKKLAGVLASGAGDAIKQHQKYEKEYRHWRDTRGY
ncbi:hypothetical protein [Bradyrhizobium elkanii]|uniref:hypothetical protein n=1 Tax=Bradyrhizobium elkanii TaxID=29448 RepID=UPI0035122B1F